MGLDRAHRDGRCGGLRGLRPHLNEALQKHEQDPLVTQLPIAGVKRCTNTWREIADVRLPPLADVGDVRFAPAAIEV
jgi:hypothetical protein